MKGNAFPRRFDHGGGGRGVAAPAASGKEGGARRLLADLGAAGRAGFRRPGASGRRGHADDLLATVSGPVEVTPQRVQEVLDVAVEAGVQGVVLSWDFPHTPIESLRPPARAEPLLAGRRRSPLNAIAS